MRRALAGLILLLFLPGVLAETVGVTLSIGETVKVNGMNVTLVDVSSNGGAAVRINGTLYVLSFGDNVTINNLSIVVGSVFPDRGQARLFFIGKRVKLTGGETHVELSTQIHEVLLSPGEEVGIGLTVKNLGESGYVPLSVQVPEGWTGILKSGSVSVLGLYLKHGESFPLTLVLKAGSTPGTYRIKVGAGNASVTILAVVQGRPLQAYVDCPGKEAVAGTNVSFSLHLSSSTPTDVPLSARAPPGWSVRFLAGGSPVRIVRVSGERTVTVLVSIPSNASVGDHPLKILAGNESVWVHVYVTETHAGENGTLVVRVVDESSGTYVGGAKVELTGGGISTRAVTLPDGTAVLHAPEGVYKLIVSKEAYKKVTETVKLKAGEKTEVTVNLEKLPYYFDVFVPAPSKSVVLGETLTYEVILRNLGKESDSYSLTLRVPPNWGGMVVESPESRTGISSTYVDAGKEKRLYVILIPPDTAKLGNYTANLTIRSLGSDMEKKVTLRAQLMGSYGIAIGLERYSVKVKAGGETTLSVRVYNTGTSPLTNVKLKVDAPQGWNVQVTPERVASVEKNGEVTFTVKINVPGNVDAGDYFITLTAESDQKKTQEQVRVTVTKGSGATYLGIGMILAALVILAVILRKYGRR
ncbi:COG1470 family protein [Thermococcus prieurii]